MRVPPPPALLPALLGAVLLGSSALGAPVVPVEPGEAAPPASTPAPTPPPAPLPGRRWDTPPDRLPTADTLGPEGLDDLARALARADTAAALRAAERLSETLSGEEAQVAWLARGLLHRAAGRHNLASEAFTRVRLGGGALAPRGAFHEAEQDLLRGRHGVALRECRRYRSRWPDGEQAADCHRIEALALAHLGADEDAMASAEAWEQAHPTSPITEQVRLALARAEAREHPQAAVAHLRDLTVTFSAPRTERLARRMLAELDAEGVIGAVPPDDLPSLQGRARSLRDSGRLAEAWALFTDLARRAADDLGLARWVEESASTFAWRTRHHEALEPLYTERYAEDPDGDTAWYAYRAAARGGHYEAARRWIDEGLSEHAGHRRWRRGHETVARTQLLAGDYDDAVQRLDHMAAKGGATGRRNAYFAAFATMQAGRHDEALRRFTALIDEGRGLGEYARYWRAKLVEADDPATAAADRAWILEQAPDSWYATLLTTGAQPSDAPRPWHRDGRWPGPRPTTPAAPRTRPAPTAVAPAVGAMAPLRQRPASPGFSLLAWPLGPAAEAPVASLERWVGAPHQDVPPADYPATPWYDPTTSAQVFDAFVDTWGRYWPRLREVRALSAAGLEELSGPVFSAWYEDWRTAVRRGDATARRLSRETDRETWRALFAHARDHHHHVKHIYDLHTYATDADTRRRTLQLEYPLAHRGPVWTHGRTQGLDPYLVLGLMRTESIYDANAVSRVGARGPMQIMPRTGHLMADLLGDDDFTAAALHEPELAVGYGVAYLGLLMDRFDGAFPLAVAAYNGGPHNVSAWLDGTGRDMPLDVFVEHIPFSETRRYVRSVTARYHRYLNLYAPEGSALHLPGPPWADDATVVDF